MLSMTNLFYAQKYKIMNQIESLLWMHVHFCRYISGKTAMKATSCNIFWSLNYLYSVQRALIDRHVKQFAAAACIVAKDCRFPYFISKLVIHQYFVSEF